MEERLSYSAGYSFWLDKVKWFTYLITIRWIEFSRVVGSTLQTDRISESRISEFIQQDILWKFSYFIYKNFDYPEKPLKYKHIRRISDWFYYQFTTFNGLRLDMPEHLASMKQPNTNATHWRRGTSAITQFHIAPHWRRYLIPTGKQGTPLFFYPHVTQ